MFCNFQPPRNLMTTLVEQSRLYFLFLAAILMALTGCTGLSSASEPVQSSSSEQPSSTVVNQPENQLVVVIHGMGRTRASMLAVQWELSAAGYEVVNWGYSSTCCTIEELGEQLAAELHGLDGEFDEIHFVGHSLGNIIARWVVTNDPPEQTGKMVMLAPPNQGAEVADQYSDWMGWLFEPLDELVTDEDSTVRQLDPVDERPVGIIAGEHDGKVSVEESKLGEQNDHEVVSSHHTFIMNRSDVREKIMSFLEDGEF